MSGLLTKTQFTPLLKQLKLEWEVLDNKRSLRHEFKFKGFSQAMEFVNKVAKLAEEENHHPNIHIYYSKVVIDLTTHSVGGLSKNDFLLAAKIENI